MEINYKKNNNTKLFNDFKNIEFLNLFNCQNYIPIYNNFFNLNQKNYNDINLNNVNTLHSINSKINENIYNCIIDNSNVKINKDVFFKLSGIIDPYKYLSGKYNLNDNIFLLPKFINDDDILKKVTNPNNTCYVDAFFSYLTSILFNKMNFIHGTDFYGSFIGIKNNYLVNICDEIDSYSCNNFFQNNINKLFHFIDSDFEKLINNFSKKNKKILEIDKNIEDLSSILIINLDNLNINKDNNINLKNSEVNLYEIDNSCNSSYSSENLSKSNYSSRSSRSSRSSNTNKSNKSNKSNTNSDSNSDINSDSDSESTTSSELENIMILINQFPIQIIALENCKDTLDSLLTEDKISNEELGSIITQILMILITYQKMFSFTHNDLHTNNIMYIETDKIYLYYKVNGKHYKVKTFGKIFKIIDFGRSIYKFKENLMCSDSFDFDGDANSQYNFEPFYNNKKPLLEPNYSFDLCRLGCSIYDFISEKYENMKEIKNPIHKIIINWCNDDDNLDILYKSNGEERYPDFKLYKMISRKVHNHKPINELQNSYFDKFIVPKKAIKKGSFIWNIDELEHQ